MTPVYMYKPFIDSEHCRTLLRKGQGARSNKSDNTVVYNVHVECIL